GAQCKAAVEGATVIVDGLIEGDVQARERVQLNAKARVIGDIISATLVVAEGATFSGHCRVGADVLKAKPAPGAPTVVENAQRRTVGGGGGGGNMGGQTELESTLAGLEARLATAHRAGTNGAGE